MPYPAHAVLGFPGQFANSQQLAGAQHYYNRYRDYDVNTGRYIQADPIGLAGDDNPYLYASGNPLKYGDPLGLNPAALRVAIGTGEALGGGLTIWCRANISLCMRTIAPVAIRVAKTCDSMIEILLNKAHPPGYWPADKGAEEWGRRNGVDKDKARRRFHDIKGGRGSWGRGKENYGVNPDTGDVIDPNGDSVGSLDD